MKKLELFRFLMEGPTREVQQFLKDNGVDLRKSEIKKLREVFQNAQASWLFTGVPESVIKKAESIVGAERVQQFLKQIQ
ncbi:hypothetical protein [Lysinibacillus sp. 3P01SB]|uniref:hypothetical protein n=1 Tax=Lysinibacillus sp. 3P01SB TaxID=3132284 RepID=UPI0039A5F1EA